METPAFGKVRRRSEGKEHEVDFRSLSVVWLLVPSGIAMLWLLSKAEPFWQHREEMSFGYGVPLLCFYLFWRAWENRPPVRFRWSTVETVLTLCGTALVFVGQVLYASFGSLASNLAVLACGLLAFQMANVGFVFGLPGMRLLFPAYAFMLLALPVPSGLQGPIISALQSLVTTVNVEVLNLVGIPAQQAGAVIQLPNGAVGISEACSGIRSLQATLMMSLFISYLKLRHTGLRVLLVGLGVFWALFGNSVRSLFLSYVANAKGTAAVEGYHDPAGWGILVFTFVVLMGSAGLLRSLELVAAKTPAKRAEAPRES